MASDPAGGDGSPLRVEIADAIATLTFDRPEALNALTIPLKEALLRAIRRMDRDPAVRAIVLTGAGRAFCAGQDLKERLAPHAPPLSVVLRDEPEPLRVGSRERRPDERQLGRLGRPDEPRQEPGRAAVGRAARRVQPGHLGDALARPADRRRARTRAGRSARRTRRTAR